MPEATRKSDCDLLIGDDNSKFFCENGDRGVFNLDMELDEMDLRMGFADVRVFRADAGEGLEVSGLIVLKLM